MGRFKLTALPALGADNEPVHSKRQHDTMGVNAESDAMNPMTKLLEKAIAKVRELPAEDQDIVAVAVLSMAEEMPIVALDDEARAAIREGLEQARRGEFLPDEEIDALWKRHEIA
ncbi:MAG: hypothetical protein ACLPID_11105 [Beijerinckiaceae bacterium]